MAEKLRQRRLNVQAPGADKPVPHPDDTGDVSAWQEAVVREMEQKHAEERNQLIAVRPYIT